MLPSSLPYRLAATTVANMLAVIPKSEQCRSPGCATQKRSADCNFGRILSSIAGRCSPSSTIKKNKHPKQMTPPLQPFSPTSSAALSVESKMSMTPQLSSWPLMSTPPPRACSAISFTIQNAIPCGRRTLAEASSRGDACRSRSI